ncbi:hypothetical protein VTK56DRAFT_8008 [Thermocarpiscus australiensis]
MAPTTDTGLSFGVELEFVFYFKLGSGAPDTQGNDDEDEAAFFGADESRPLPPVLRCSTAPTRLWAANLIEEAILSVPGAKIEGRPLPAGSPNLHPHLYLYKTDGWVVKDDQSVRDDKIAAPPGGGYAYESFEINSPALWDRPASHRHVYRVVAELARRFRTRVNLRTGFHCHVGGGCEPHVDEHGKPIPVPDYVGDGHDGDLPVLRPRRHPLGVLKRAAALMWAADGFLCHAHPPERGINAFAPPIRHSSRLAYGLRKMYFREDPFGIDSREVPLADDVPLPPQHADPVPHESLGSYRVPRLHRAFFPALRPDRPDDEAVRRYATLELDEATKELDRLVVNTVDRGVAHIMRCRNREQLAELLAVPDRCWCSSARLNYNLAKYDRAWDVTSWPMHSGTVEFREATGTTCAEWVTAWANICLGFFRFARNAHDDVFWAVIAQLSRAEAAARAGVPHRYDMISLLFDMGLFAEGLFLERRLREDPLRFWYPNRLPEPPPEDSRAVVGPPVQPASVSRGGGGAAEDEPYWGSEAESTPLVTTPVEAEAEPWEGDSEFMPDGNW